MSAFRFFVLPLVLGLVACSSGSDQSPEESFQPKTVKVVTQVVQSAKVPVSRSFPGTVASADTAVLTPKVVGYIESFQVRPGDTFHKGDVLVKIKSKELIDKEKFAQSAVKEAENAKKQAALGLNMAKAGLKQAEAQFLLAQNTYRRFENLLKTESASKQEFDEVEAKYRAARESKRIAEENVKLAVEKHSQVNIKRQQADAMLDEVKTYLSYTTLKAPFNGIVLQKMVDMGNLAAPGQPVLKIGSLGNVVYAQVNSSAIKLVQVGRDVEVEVPAAKKRFTAKVLEIDPNVDPATRNFKIKLSGDEAIIPGMYANVFLGEDVEKATLVPGRAVLERGQLSVIFVKKDGKAEMRIVKTGRTIGDKVEIVSGLRPDERIVVENGESLRTGDVLEE
ncbi:MAG: efflux RND transporter periplasmic adaptor subunit [Deltaproteobacteria bacterium]|nr:MAG: efflux RND transporter periplasmic adaptor subunit [Deltaproteobacteria bacterium]